STGSASVVARSPKPCTSSVAASNVTGTSWRGGARSTAASSAWRRDWSDTKGSFQPRVPVHSDVASAAIYSTRLFANRVKARLPGCYRDWRLVRRGRLARPWHRPHEPQLPLVVEQAGPVRLVAPLPRSGRLALHATDLGGPLHHTPSPLLPAGLVLVLAPVALVDGDQRDLAPVVQHPQPMEQCGQLESGLVVGEWR